MKKTQKFRTLALVAGVSTLYGLCGAYAAVLPVTSTIKFMSDITFVSTSGPNFGYVKAATVATCVLSTAGVVTGCTSEGGTPAAGVYTIKGSGTGLINISANGYTLNGTSTPSLATCSYNSVAVGGANCTGTGLAAPGAAGLPLLVGLTVATTGGVDGTTDSPTFNLNVVYQ